MEAVLEHRGFEVPSQEGLRAWRSPSRGVVYEGFHAAPPSTGSFAGAEDWEEIAPPHEWDHEHCEFCWATFVPAAKVPAKSSEDSEYLTEGYVSTEPEPGLWICPRCFADFREEFRWSVRGDSPGLRRPPS